MPNDNYPNGTMCAHCEKKEAEFLACECGKGPLCPDCNEFGGHDCELLEAERMKRCPEKIYLQPFGVELGVVTEPIWEETDPEVSFCEDKLSHHDVEYVRVDCIAARVERDSLTEGGG